MTAGDVGLLGLGLTGFVFVLVGRFVRDVAPNRWAGVRTPWTYADRRVWDDTNRRAARGFTRLGWATIVTSVLFLPLEDGLAIATLAIALTAAAIALAADSIWYSRQRLRYYRELDAGGGSGQAPGG